MKYDVIALGELLVDFTPSGYSEQGNPLYESNPGGAPCNVLAMLAKLGKRVGFIGKVGNDLHGRFLRQALISAGISETGLIISNEHDTTLAFVALAADGERDFAFIRRAGADIALTPCEVDKFAALMIGNAKIFHFGSVSMTDEPARSATKRAVLYAKENNCIITFDPNLRKLLWDSLGTAKEQMLWGSAHCDIIKLAKEELFFLANENLTDKNDLDEAVSVLRLKFPKIKLILVTDGKNGSYAYFDSMQIYQPAVLTEKTIDTTGAGDAFFGYCIDFLLNSNINSLTKEQLSDMLKKANTAASLITTKKGAFKAIYESSPPN
jgi:fructokinase